MNKTMSEKNDGGPAFPVPIQKLNHDTRPEDFDACNCAGMTLRDYFAGHAMTGMFALISLEDAKQRTPFEIRAAIAAGAYLTADAMLKERGRA